MIKSRLVPFLLAVCFLARTPAKARQSPEPGDARTFSRINGVPFAQGKSAPLLADMYLPQGNRLAPAIIFVHGGGWIGGTRGAPVIEPLAEHGYVGMAIDYDVSPEVHFPIALEECKAAVRWLRAHAAQYHVDPIRIAVEGALREENSQRLLP